MHSLKVSRWQLVISADAGQIEAPPVAGGAVANDEIAQLLTLQSARTPAQIAIFNKWNNRAASQWNEIARDLVIKNDTESPPSSRIYATLGVAQYDATIAAERAQANFNRATPAQIDARIAPLSTIRDGYPALTAALFHASADVLKSLYPNDKAQIESAETERETSRLVGGVSFPSDIEAGAQVGDAVAAKVIARLATDGGINNGHAVADLAIARSQNDGYSDGAPKGRALSFAELKNDPNAELNRRASGGKNNAN